MSETSATIVKYCLLGFNVLGTFGLLLGLLACCDVVCLWYEMQSFIRISFGLTESSLLACFWANSGYIFMENFEVYVVMALAIDRQLAISIPVKYRLFKNTTYFSLLLTPGIIIGLLFVISYFRITNIIRDICVLPYAMPDEVAIIWNYYNTAGAIVTMVVYSFTYSKLYYFQPFKNEPNQARKQKTILSTVIVQAMIFFASSVVSALVIMGVRAMGWEKLAVDADTLAVIPGLLGYSCNFYVYFWRSAEYRSIFQRQLLCGRVFFRDVIPMTSVSLSAARRKRREQGLDIKREFGVDEINDKL